LIKKNRRNTMSNIFELEKAHHISGKKYWKGFPNPITGHSGVHIQYKYTK